MHSDLTALEATFDGPIPRALRRTTHRNLPARSKTFRATVRLTGLKPAFMLPAMTTVLVDAFHARGVATEGDLHLAGFDAAAITRHGPAARRAALTLLTQQGRDLSDLEAA